MNRILAMSKVSRETSANKGEVKAKCKVHGDFVDTLNHKVLSHNSFGYICEDCWKNGVISTQGIFATNLIETQAKKDASHGVKISYEIPMENLTNDQRGWMIATYAVDRIGSKYVSTPKIGTWQLSKVSDFLGSDKVVAIAYKDGYTLKGSTELIIKATRDISSNHGKLSDRIIKEYGFKKYGKGETIK